MLDIFDLYEAFVYKDYFSEKKSEASTNRTRFFPSINI